jgi:hypothetical protein
MHHRNRVTVPQPRFGCSGWRRQGSVGWREPELWPDPRQSPLTGFRILRHGEPQRSGRNRDRSGERRKARSGVMSSQREAGLDLLRALRGVHLRRSLVSVEEGERNA